MPYDSLAVYLGKEYEKTKLMIAEAAQRRDMSVSAFVLYCIRYTVEHETKKQSVRA